MTRQPTKQRKTYRFLEDVSLADAAFEAYGKTPAELFTHAAEATCATMVELATVRPRIRRRVTLKADSLESLLFKFLGEIIYLKDADYFLFSRFAVAITQKGKDFHLRATLEGEHIRPEVHRLGTDVKAVTLHLFSVKKERALWKATVVLDV